ncbi:MAG: B12-binding domain-containing radical SAM protein [Nitrospinota bacterium]|nr:B12-binding domain-containing radical SAM protein [Nitrospinota bacterium]
MKVLLLNTPDLHVGKTTSDWDLDATDIGVFPPVGLMFLAASVRASGKHQVKIVDTILNKMNAQDVAREVEEWKPDVVGITVYTPTLYDTFLVCREVRKVAPQTPIVWGGPHTWEFPEESIIHKEIVDYVIVGEAEESFTKFLDTLEDGGSLDDIAGLFYRKPDKSIFRSQKAGYTQNLDSLPFPAFDLLDYNRYYSAMGTGAAVGTICSSRGCPFKCTYCVVPFKTYRSRSVENIVEEIQLYRSHGVKEFFFFDDLFNANVRRFKAISEGIIAAGITDITWAFRGRVDAINDECLVLAKKAGLRRIFFGVEDATDEGLVKIKKRITIEKVRRSLALCRKHGILTSTNWIIGFPHHEKREDILHLIDTAVDLNSDYAQFNICIAYNDTDIWRQGVEKGLFPADYWKNFALDPTPSLQEPIWDEHMSREELSELLRLCYNKFYFRPGPIIKKLFAMQSFGEFWLHVKGAFTLLGFGGYRRSEHETPTTAQK